MINLQTLIAYCRIKYPNMNDYHIEQTLIYCHIHHIFTYGHPLFNESVYGSFNLRGYYQDLKFIYLDEENQDSLRYTLEHQAEFYKYQTKSLVILDFNKHYENAQYNYNCDSERNINKTLEYLSKKIPKVIKDFLEFEHNCKYEESIVNKYDDIFDKIKHKIKPNQTINVLELVKLFDIDKDMYNLLVLNIENSYCLDITNNHYDNKYSIFDYRQFKTNDKNEYCLIRIGEQILVQSKEVLTNARETHNYSKFYLITDFYNCDIIEVVVKAFQKDITKTFDYQSKYKHRHHYVGDLVKPDFYIEDVTNIFISYEGRLRQDDNTSHSVYINLCDYSHHNQKQFILDLNTCITNYANNPETVYDRDLGYGEDIYRDLKNIQSNLINHLVNFL